MSGGIIINRTKHLLDTITDPSFLHFLHPHDQAKVADLTTKGPDGLTNDDATWMTRKLHEVQSQAAKDQTATEAAEPVTAT
jgi:hypothetical protein